MLLIIISFFLNSALSCAPNEFQCGDNTCVTQNFRCDNFEDCRDGSDEIGCITKGCKPGEFRCEDGMCITNEFRCDHFKDCRDGSDEMGCNAAIQKPNCSKGCTEPILLYEDLNCKPKHVSGESCCPSAFDCSHIEVRTNLVEERCHFHGKTYNIGETITNTEIYGTCSSNCTCRRNRSGRVAFDCKEVICSEWSSHNRKSGCHLKYELGRCCSTGEVCVPFHASCKVNGKIYYEGMQFDSPSEKCEFCVCKLNHLGQSILLCSKHQCVQEVRYHNEVMNFCAPSYLTLNDCCPINWICPQNDKIIYSKTFNQKSKLKCRFGNLQLRIGDKFKRSYKPGGGKVLCECRIPPYLTCIQDYNM